jgi:hypothetical protein
MLAPGLLEKQWRRQARVSAHCCHATLEDRDEGRGQGRNRRRSLQRYLEWREVKSAPSAGVVVLSRGVRRRLLISVCR